MVQCPWLCAHMQCLKLLNISDLLWGLPCPLVYLLGHFPSSQHVHQQQEVNQGMNDFLQGAQGKKKPSSNTSMLASNARRMYHSDSSIPNTAQLPQAPPPANQMQLVPVPPQPLPQVRVFFFLSFFHSFHHLKK